MPATERFKFKSLKRGLLMAASCAVVAFSGTTAIGQQVGPNTIVNGTSTGIIIPGFRFEPEVPFASLKEVPTWNELEQLLDNPYLVTPDPATPGTDQLFPSYRATGVVRRPSFGGVTLPALLVDPLNYNPTTGEEMRLLNSHYVSGTARIPDQLVQCTDPSVTAGNIGLELKCPAIADPNTYVWTYKTVTLSDGVRVNEGAAIDYNAPFIADTMACIVQAEAVPPEGSIICGGDPGEPDFQGFGVLDPTFLTSSRYYSTPAVPTSVSIAGLPGAFLPAFPATGSRLFDPTRPAALRFINPRNANGVGGLKKPSLQVRDAGGRRGVPNYLVNEATLLAGAPGTLTTSNENDYVRNRSVAIALGKSLFWDMQVGSDGVQSCGTCHFTGAGTDTRTKNQLNPNHLGGHLSLEVGDTPAADGIPGHMAANYELKLSDYPFMQLANPDVAGDPLCTTPIVANVNGGLLENLPNARTGATGTVASGVSMTVCDAANHINADVDDVTSSMGVVFSPFLDIPAPGGGRASPAFVQVVGSAATTPRPVAPDIRTVGALDPIPVFQGLRRVEPRNTPTQEMAAFNFDNFWDGRARHDFNGGSVFGAADPQAHVFVNDGGNLKATRQLIKFSSLASLATGPGLSEFEMSFAGRNWAKVGKKLLQAGVTPLANQLVDPTDSVLGPYSNQPGNAAPVCSSLAALGNRAVGKPGLCVSYPDLVRAAYYPRLWNNGDMHLNGSSTAPAPIPILGIDTLGADALASATKDPFDGYSLSIANGAAAAADTNQFRQMEGNFSLFWGLSVDLWVQILVADNTPLDQLLDANPDAFATLGEPGELGLVEGQLNCIIPGDRYCFREVGNFKRDPGAMALRNATGEGGTGGVAVPAGGTRNPATDPDPLLGMDIFFSSNMSLKNPNFRTARCGECHAIPTLTDHTMPFTFKTQLRDFVAEFVNGRPGQETLVEPLGRLRLISGFLLESEINEAGQDGVERRIANQSISTCPTDGLSYPGGLEPDLSGTGAPGFGLCGGAAAGYFDNGVYNLGVRPIGDDIGRGGTDAFGWPLSLATLMLKNVGGVDYRPGTELPTFDATLGSSGGVFEESKQDQQLNPGFEGQPVTPMLPPYLAGFTNQINVGDSMPELDEPFSGLNTLTDIAMLEGFLDTLGPLNPAGILNESLNFGDGAQMGSWPFVNRVGRDGSFKAAQLRNVELTGPYFHNGGKATLRQVVDFYSRGGDFPMTNAAHRDFNMVNNNMDVQANLSEEEKVALVDFLLELTDDRVAYDRAPFDHPEVIIPVDGTAPDNTFGRPGLLARTAPGTCGTGPCFRDISAVGAAGFAAREPTFLNLTRQRLVGDDAFSIHDSLYSH